MRLYETCQWWELNNEGKRYTDSLQVNEKINKEAMWSFILKECGAFPISWEDSEYYHYLVEQFFIIHKWNIDKLVETTAFDYKPLDNFEWTQERELDRDLHTSDTTEQNDHTEQDAGNVWTEKGNDYSTKTHLISAYNDDESPTQVGVDNNGNPIYQYKDTEKWRDIDSGNYSKQGTNSMESSTDYDSNKDRQLQTDEDVGEKIHKWGNTGVTYQSLIEEERRVAEFNIYKWILKHFIHEMVIPVYY